jgi:putative PIN family toxin of toxin-antitoxin system
MANAKRRVHEGGFGCECARSAAIHRLGKSRQIVTRATTFRYEWLTCEHILVKAAEVLTRPHIQRKYGQWVTPSQQQEFFELVRQVAVVVDVQSQVNVVGDQEDDVVLACARDGQADYVVSGDPHLTNLGEFEGVKIVTPGQFLEALQKEESSG